jgi:hypothetical protein
MSTDLTDHDEYTIHVAAHGVVALMASSAPGTFSAPRAGIAAAKAMSTATGLVGEVLAQKPPKLPFEGSVATTAETVLPALTESVRILDRARNGEGDNFRRTMLRTGRPGSSRPDVSRVEGDLAESVVVIDEQVTVSAECVGESSHRAIARRSRGARGSDPHRPSPIGLTRGVRRGGLRRAASRAAR